MRLKQRKKTIVNNDHISLKLLGAKRLSMVKKGKNNNATNAREKNINTRYFIQI